MGFSTGMDPSGMYAWRSLFSVIMNPRRRNLASIWANSSGSETSSREDALATISRVKSSWVGPIPPEVITTSDRSIAAVIVSSIRSGLSPTMVL